MNSYLTEINLKPIHQWSYFWRSLSSQVSVLEYYFPFSPFFNKEDQSPHHKKNEFSLHLFPFLSSLPSPLHVLAKAPSQSSHLK